MKNHPQTIRLAISTCPNDTFAFHGLMSQQIDLRGLQFDVELMDIQQLNDRLMYGDYDIAKASYHAALRIADSCVILPSGSALGFGVGPLLLSARSGDTPHAGDQQITVCPGEFTTAALLFRLFYPGMTRVQHVVFSDIMPLLKQRRADFGVCIHEGRFTFQDEGLSLVEDLGTRWESTTACPLPLGGIFANRSMPSTTIRKVQDVIEDSIKFALSSPSDALSTMREYAQAFNDDVLMKHVELYVNQWTVNLGPEGRSAIDALSRLAQETGLVEQSTRLRILDE